MDENSRFQPGTYFISHAYRDRKPLRRLLQHLPPGVSPYVFPPIQVSPVDYVSNPLIDALARSTGVIVLKGGHSDASFWVAFERDYALRAGKLVHAFDPTTGQFERLTLHPDEPMTLPLAIHCFVSINDRTKIDATD